MKYGKIKGLDKPVSRIIFGCMNGVMDRGNNCDEALDAALEAGINTFDTARIYGKSEEVLGRWLQGKDREKIVVLTKCAHPSMFRSNRVKAECINADFARSLDKLKLDYVDILLLHKDHPDADIPSVLETLHALKECGKVRAIGVSNWEYERIAAANEYADAHGLTPITVSSPYFGLAAQKNQPWRGCISIGDNQKAIKWYCENKMPVFAYSSLARGLMSGKYRHDDKRLISSLDLPARRGFLTDENIERLSRAEKLADQLGCTVAQICLAWMFAQDMEVYAVLSQSARKRVMQNVAAVDIQLTKEQADWLDLKSYNL